MTVTNDAVGGAPMTLRNSNTITFRDGSGVNRSCFSPVTGAAATSFNTTKIRVRTSSAAAFQDTVIDESNNGRFVTAAGARMFIVVTTGTGNDHLDVRLGTGIDTANISSGGLSFGPSIDLDRNGTPDIAMTLAGLVSVDGGAGSDLLDGTGALSFQLELKGGIDGNDTLRGGKLTDFLSGGPGIDRIESKGDNTRDFVDGGADLDRAFVDFGRDSVVNVETVE
jgi:Ca2+-binding RTX toxin-like protein